MKTNINIRKWISKALFAMNISDNTIVYHRALSLSLTSTTIESPQSSKQYKNNTFFLSLLCFSMWKESWLSNIYIENSFSSFSIKNQCLQNWSRSRLKREFPKEKKRRKTWINYFLLSALTERSSNLLTGFSARELLATVGRESEEDDVLGWAILGATAGWLLLLLLKTNLLVRLVGRSMGSAELCRLLEITALLEVLPWREDDARAFSETSTLQLRSGKKLLRGEEAL